MTRRIVANPILTAEAARIRLEAATFRLYLGKHWSGEYGRRVHFFGTGFFVVAEGVALTAYHNLSGCSPKRIYRAEYAGRRIRLKWDQQLSSRQADIAVLRLHDPHRQVAVHALPAGYLGGRRTLGMADHKRFFMGRTVFLYGFPQSGATAKGWFLPAQVDMVQPIFPINEDGEWVERLCLLGGALADALEGISGAALLDQESGRVIGVEGSYQPGPAHGRLVFGTELARLVEEHPELGRYLHQMHVAPCPPGPTLRLWREVWQERRALRRYLARLRATFRSFTVLSHARPFETERVFLELKVRGHVPPHERPQPDGRSVRAGEPLAPRGATDASQALASTGLRYLLVGEPGAGKTTLLRHLAFGLASRSRSLAGLARAWTPSPVAEIAGRFGCPLWGDRLTRYPVPFYLALNDLAEAGDTLEERLAEAIEPGDGFPDPMPFVQRLLGTHRCAVLLDGLDEVMDPLARQRAASMIKAFVAHHPQIPVVVTCRTAALAATEGDRQPALLDPGFAGFGRFEIEPFDETQVEAFLRNWFRGVEPASDPNRADALLAVLHGNLAMRRLAANPLLLSLIALVYERELRLPQRRVELYTRCTELLLDHLDRARGLELRFPLQTKLEVLAALAAEVHQAGLRRFNRDFLRQTVNRAVPPPMVERTEDFIQELLERGGLVRLEARDAYGFAHLTVQEFMTARHYCKTGDVERLLKHIGEDARREVNPAARKAIGDETLKHTGRDAWREVILLFVGLQSDPTSILEQLRQRDLLLAAAALADGQALPTPGYRRVGQDIVGALKRLHAGGGARSLAAADALAGLQDWGAREYLVSRSEMPIANTGSAADKAALTALLALLGVASPLERAHLWPELGPTLRRLHDALGRCPEALRPRLLESLELLGFPLVFVPGGPFLMGSDDRRDGGSMRTVTLPPYWMSKHPVTKAQFARFVAEQQQVFGRPDRAFQPGEEDHPVVHITWHEALAYCQWAGLSLPTTAEWEKAARGADGRVYPWGNDWDPSRCNISGRGTTPVRDHPRGASPYGCLDMSGNVWEWTVDQSAHRPAVTFGGLGGTGWGQTLYVLRGGAFDGDQLSVRCTSSCERDAGTGYDNRGFRGIARPAAR